MFVCEVLGVFHTLREKAVIGAVPFQKVCPPPQISFISKKTVIYVLECGCDICTKSTEHEISYAKRVITISNLHFSG